MAMPDHTSRPRLLDLFCGAGGCSVGYERAGFDVTGVDVAPQPNYPCDFLRADVLELLPESKIADFDAIHASPPRPTSKLDRQRRRRAQPGDTDQEERGTCPAPFYLIHLWIILWITLWITWSAGTGVRGWPSICG